MKQLNLFLAAACILTSGIATAQPGSLDNTFGTSGKVTTDFGNSDDGRSIAIQSDGKILVAGYSDNGSNVDFALVRYNSDGSLDNTFDTDGKLTTDIGSYGDEGNSVAIQSDGKILVAGESWNGSNSTYDFALVRYNGGSTGISENSNDALFSVEPNPTTGMFTIELATQKNVPYEVTDISGKMLHKGMLTEKRTTIDLSKNEAGVYLLKIDGQSIRLIKK